MAGVVGGAPISGRDGQLRDADLRVRHRRCRRPRPCGGRDHHRPGHPQHWLLACRSGDPGGAVADASARAVVAGPAGSARVQRGDRRPRRSGAADGHRRGARRTQHSPGRCRDGDHQRARRSAAVFHRLPSRALPGGHPDAGHRCRHRVERLPVGGDRARRAATDPGLHGAHRAWPPQTVRRRRWKR